jgi:hypothetical protein
VAELEKVGECDGLPLVDRETLLVEDHDCVKERETVAESELVDVME